MNVFCKLGGSLITDKNKPHTARVRMLDRLAGEIAAAKENQPDLQLVLGHGSGSFGHIPGKKYGTRQGVFNNEQWRGFVEVWQEARALNEIVLAALQRAGLPVICFPASACATTRDGLIENWDLTPLNSALQHGAIPLVFGDTCFDFTRGGTIVSTEDIFAHLAPVLKPQRILLAGIETGVWSDYPRCTRLVKKITPDTFSASAIEIHGSAAPDVTGGMRDKVDQALKLVTDLPQLRISIFTGLKIGNLTRAFAGAEPGTTICQQ